MPDDLEEMLNRSEQEARLKRIEQYLNLINSRTQKMAELIQYLLVAAGLAFAIYFKERYFS